MNDTTAPPQPPAEDAAAKLAEIRTVLDGFEFGRDDLQFAMEQVIDVVYGPEWAGRTS